MPTGWHRYEGESREIRIRGGTDFSGELFRVVFRSQAGPPAWRAVPPCLVRGPASQKCEPNLIRRDLALQHVGQGDAAVRHHEVVT